MPPQHQGENEVLEVQRGASDSFSLILGFSFLFFHPCSDCQCYFTQLLAEQWPESLFATSESAPKCGWQGCDVFFPRKLLRGRHARSWGITYLHMVPQELWGSDESHCIPKSSKEKTQRLTEILSFSFAHFLLTVEFSRPHGLAIQTDYLFETFIQCLNEDHLL